MGMNPRDRYTAEQTLSHVWIANKAPKAKQVTLQTGMIDRLKNFRSHNKLKKAALHVIAQNLDESKIKGLREVFTQLDSNGDGLLTLNEMKEGLSKAGLKDIPDDIKQIMESVDADGSGVIDYTEFLAATLDKKQFMTEDICWQAFKQFDRNGDGKIDKDELKLVLTSGEVDDVATRSIAELLADVDTDGDGEI